MLTVLCACSQLYGEFADPLGLAECQLAIVHCAGHHDPTLIETLWKNIIDKGQLTSCHISRVTFLLQVDGILTPVM